MTCGTTRLNRWQAASPFDALSWALSLKNRRAARALLEKRAALTWLEASRYAPLTLGWAPDLLAMILDRVPEGEEELFCLHTFPCPGDGREMIVESSLLTAAAALDDLAAVELLLARGNCELNEHELYKALYLSPHSHEYGRIRSNIQLVNLAWLALQDGPVRENGPRSFSYLEHAGPLSAAIYCGARRCALRLLPEAGGELDLSVRWALTRTEFPENEAYRATVEAVTAELGVDLAELLDPGDFRDRRQPLFRECLKRHGGQAGPAMIQCLLDQGREKEWAREALRCVDPLLLSGVLLDLARRGGRLSTNCHVSFKDVQYILYQPGLELVLDRNAVPPEADTKELLAYLDRAQVVGELPEGELSGLAVNLLDHILMLTAGTPRAGLTALTSSIGVKALTILAQENPKLVREYLLGKAERLRIRQDACAVVNFLLSLMGIQWEVDYEL